jgi:hypothetical protein
MNEFNDAPVDVSKTAEKWGIPYPVYITDKLKNAITPNEFLSDMGVQFSERLDNIMGFLKGTLVPKGGEQKETLPKDGASIPFVLLKGPFVREIPVSIRAELKPDSESKSQILLSIIHEGEE